MKRFINIKSIVAISFLAVITLPIYILFYLEPAYYELITTNTEREAAQVANLMSNTFFPDHEILSLNALPKNIGRDVAQLQEQFKIIKVKIFDPKGLVIYSSDPGDLGVINRNDYFHNIVSQGSLFTKVVKKNKTSMEGQTMPVDVVETYVPIMKNSRFAGAFEIYYDITAIRTQLSRLMTRGKTTAICIALGLFIALYFTANNALKSAHKKRQAEFELQKAYDGLELRVEKRTAELRELNDALTEEILEREKAEEEKENLIVELRQALQQVKTLSGLLPICASCQQIRDEEGQWKKIEHYIQSHSNAEFTHGICPKCAKKLYPDLYEENGYS